MTASGPTIEGFTFIEHLGSGGYSDVYLYQRRSPRMRVAVKVLKDGRLGESERKQFAAEAETMAELADHPYIVQVFSADTTPDGQPYLVMKYYPPPNMGVRAAGQPYGVDSVLRTGIQISSAVEAAHRAGIVHRDIKPANLLVSQYGEPGLTDFGIAGLAAELDTTDDLGVSIPWTAPEVLSGESNGTISSDVYSLAATLWHLLAGRSPFELARGDNSARALMGRVLRNNPAPTGRPDVPASLERLLAQAMAKAPVQRPRTALEFARALQTIEQEQLFARTEIVVEGLGTTGPTPHPPADDEHDRTRMRAPIRVSPQSRPATGLGSVQDSKPYPGSGPIQNGRSEPITASRVTTSPDLAEPPTGRQRIPAPSTIARTAPTVRRPASPTSSEPVEPDERTVLSHRRLPIVAAGLVAVVVVVMVGIASNSGKTGRSPSDQPTVQDTGDTGLGSQLVAPTVVASYDAKTKILRFDWTVPDLEKNVAFRWSLRSDPNDQTRTNNHFAEVRTTSPATTCLTVQAVPIGGGTDSTSSDYVCGKGVK